MDVFASKVKPCFAGVSTLLCNRREFLLILTCKEANCPSGGVHLDLRTRSVSKISLLEVSESSSLS